MSSDLETARELVMEMANYIGNASIACGHCIGNPSVSTHSPSCQGRRTILRKARQFLEENVIG